MGIEVEMSRSLDAETKFVGVHDNRTTGLSSNTVNDKIPKKKVKKFDGRLSPPGQAFQKMLAIDEMTAALDGQTLRELREIDSLTRDA